MLVRSIGEVVRTELEVEWGNGSSRRILVQSDDRGFSLTETYVRPGTSSLLRYDNHVEACYCIDGSGVVEAGGKSYDIFPGVLYAPDKGESHVLRSDTGMTLVCVFRPALLGTEKHDLRGGVPSSY